MGPPGSPDFFLNFPKLSHFRHLGGEGVLSDPILGKWARAPRRIQNLKPVLRSPCKGEPTLQKPFCSLIFFLDFPRFLKNKQKLVFSPDYQARY